MDDRAVPEVENSNVPFANGEEKFGSEFDSLEKFAMAGFKTLVEATKSSNKLPFGKARDLYESYPIFHSLMKKEADYILSKLYSLMKCANCKGNILKRDDDEKFEMIVDANDAVLEKVGISLDEISGIRKNPEPQLMAKKLQSFSGSWNRNSRLTNNVAVQSLNLILNKAKNIEKPQKKFKDAVNNDPNIPFEPKIQYKYNMLKPLAVIAENNENGFCQFSHPYEFELTKFNIPSKQLISHPPTMYKPLEETPINLISSPLEISSVIDDLKKYKEISVDLEHHSYRSFQGFTCLMQISTRDTDYIIDALALRSDLQPLNEVFTDPTIVKVFHGADSDILWLQRDLGIYVVNMFDTHQAVKLLNYAKLSLAYLLFHYCNVEAQKHFQLADWRIRPLPEELLTYAREDTHYLLYIYDNLKNELIEKANGQTNLLESVISESTRICLKRYVKPLYEEDGYLDIYHRSKKLFDNRQKFALQRLFEWRDMVARESDESYAYVLPNHMMLNISEVLPREAQGILACCNPIPTPVRQNLFVLHQIITKAREQPLIKPVLDEQRFYRHATACNSLDNPFQWPHDLNHEGEFRDDLPVLLSANVHTHSDCDKGFDSNSLHAKPIINVFIRSMESTNKAKIRSLAEKAIHSSPYHRYKLAKKFSESEDVQKVTTTRTHFITEKINLPNSSPVVKNEPTNALDEMLAHSSLKKVGVQESIALEVEVKMEHDKDAIDNKGVSQSHKRRIKTNETLKSKKLKEDRSNFANNVQGDQGPESSSSAVKNRRKSEKTKKKKWANTKICGKRENKFQPFDYSSISFEQYKSSTHATTKKPQRKIKRKGKNGKKNFKISV